MPLCVQSCVTATDSSSTPRPCLQLDIVNDLNSPLVCLQPVNNHYVNTRCRIFTICLRQLICPILKRRYCKIRRRVNDTGLKRELALDRQTACSPPFLLKSVQFLSHPARLQTTMLLLLKGMRPDEKFFFSGSRGSQLCRLRAVNLQRKIRDCSQST